MQGPRRALEGPAEEPQARRAARRVEGLARHRRPAPSAPLFARYVELANDGRARRSASRTSRRCGSRGYDMPAGRVRGRGRSAVGPGEAALRRSCTATRARKLNKKYGDKVAPKTGPIPAHLLGNMWAQEWELPLQRSRAVQGRRADRRHADAREEATTPKKMVKIGEAFFTSLGMHPLPETFWERSMFAKPEGQGGRLPRERVGRARSTTTCASRCASSTNQEDLDHDPPRARSRLLLPQLLQAADPLSERRERRLPRGDRRHASRCR